MTWFIFIAAALLGGLGRYIYGGRIPAIGRGWSYAILAPLGVILAWPGSHGLSSWAPAIAISLALLLVWNPGHGSYMRPGKRNHADNEEFAPIVRWVAKIFGAEDVRSTLVTPTPGAPPVLGLRSTVGYDCIGLSIRYGLMTFVVAVTMLASEVAWDLDYGLWFGWVGFLAGPIIYIYSRLTFWKDDDQLWKAMEATLGALIYGAMAWAG